MAHKASKKDRLVQIMELLDDHESLEVTWLAEHFGMSDVSIRNDLSVLEDQGKLKRQHGRATIARRSVLELPLREKELRRKKEKNLIGIAAAALIENGDSVFLDAGTTTEALARNLQRHSEVTIFTNGINIVNTLLACTDLRTYFIGGEICNRSFATVGDIAEKRIGNYHTKLAFVSADGFSSERGISNNSSQANRIAIEYLMNTTKRVLLADSSKSGMICPFHLCNFDTIDVLVTDEGLSEDDRKTIESYGTEIIIAR